jgi:Flp pilus assembly protein protease CpaA
MVISLILLFLGILGLIIASYADIKTTEIPDWLSYSLIVSGLFLRISHSIFYQDFSYTTIALVNLGIFFVIGNVMYYTKQWGGGDAKLLMALSVIFATYPKELLSLFTPKLDLYFPLTIFINILIVGMFYSFLFTIYLGFKHKKDFLKEFKLYLDKTKSSRKIILVLSILLIILAIILQEPTLKLILFSSAILILITLYLWIYLKSVEKSCMYKRVKVSKLLEGDWIINDIYKNKRLIIKRPIYGITKSQINLLKKHKISNIDIKQGIVFVPSFLIATIVSLIFGNVVSYFI